MSEEEDSELSEESLSRLALSKAKKALDNRQLFLIPNKREYLLDPGGTHIIRADLVGMLRVEWREEKKRRRREKIKYLKQCRRSK